MTSLMSVNAQESNIRIGAKAGLSLSTFSRGFFYQQDDFSYIPSFYAGALLTVRTDRSISGKLELMYSGQGSYYKATYNTQYGGRYSLGYLSLGYIIHFRLFEYLFLDAGLTTDLLIKKDNKVPSPKTFDVAGLVGVEVPILPSLSLEARVKSGRGSINNYTDYYGSAPFQTELNNLVVQVGAIYYF
jgi:hypothetical protein